MAKVYYLSISSYAGIVPGACHFHGRIRSNEMEHAHDLETTELYRGKKILTGRFNSQRTLIDAAKRWLKENAAHNAILILGSHANCDPQRVLVGSRTLRKAANAIWRTYEKLGGWDDKSHYKEVQALCCAWELLFK